MPPSPAVRCSPGRELRADNNNRRRSFESGTIPRERDEDLALFNEVQNRESDSFLLQSNDDFEDSFSMKLRYFSDYKLGISVPARGESSDLLNADDGKNDYDWLTTPPDTSLFHSLDDDSTPVNVAQRGRTRTQPISVSRSSTMEKSLRSSRGSASPNRLSPSPRSGNTTFQSRGQTSPTHGSSPIPTLRPATPTRRPSSSSSKLSTQATPTRRPSSPSSKSSTLTTPTRRPSSPSSKSSTPTTPTRRPSSPSSKSSTLTTPTRRPSSPSSKPSTPGPRSSTPTLRRLSTSSSTTRGTSPVKTSRGSSASPKVKAWQSNIPGFSSEAPPNLRTSLADHPGSYVRGSSPASINGRDSSVNFRRQSMSSTASRSVSPYHSQGREIFNSHSQGSMASSGDDDVESQPSVVGSSDRSASKRVGGAFSNNRASPVSKKPSRTAPSSSAPKRSSDLALRKMDHRKSPPTNMFRPLLSSVPSTTFHAGKASAAQRVLISRNSSVTTSSNASSDLGTSGVHDNEGSDQNQDEVMSENQEDVTNKHVKESDYGVEEELFMFDIADTSNEDFGHELDSGSPRNWDGDLELTFGDHDMLLCPSCGCRYSAVESIEEDTLKLCSKCQKLNLPLTLTIIPPLTATGVAENSTTVPIVKGNESFEKLDPEQTVDEPQEGTSTSGSNSGQHKSQHCYSEPIWNFLPEEDEHRHCVSSSMPDTDAKGEEMQQSGDFPNLNNGASDGTGISILLKKSRSSIGPVVQSRNFSASSISFDDLSYVRASTNSMRSSIGHGTSFSASSSIDLGHFPKQLSSRKSDIENYRFDPFAKHQRSVSSLSGNSSQPFHPSSLGTSIQDLYEPLVVPSEKDTAHVSYVPSQEPLIMSECSTASYENVEDSKSNIWEGDGSATSPTTVDSVDVAEVPSQSSLDMISEIEIENNSQHSAGSHYDDLSSSCKSSIDEPIEPSVLSVSDDVAVQAKECDTSDHAHSIAVGSTVMITSEGGTPGRSLTLEEAMDTILFCRSIVHNLAYEAATIAINKENPAPSEFSWELIPTTGKSDTDNRDPHSKNVGKRASKSQKSRQKVETESNPPSGAGADKLAEKSNSPTKTRLVGVPVNGESMKPPKLESKCYCTIM